MFVEQDSEPVLTPRETEVLEQVANGFSAKETANALSIAPRTVERHIENVRLKLRARNRAHMITRAVGLGVLGVGDAANAGRDSREPELMLCGGGIGREAQPA